MKSIKLHFYYTIMLLVVAGCGESNESTSNWDINTDGMKPSENTGDWIFIHELSDSESLNPYTGNDASGSYILANIFETMLKQDNNTLEYKPWLATSLPEVSKDKLVYTFTLRKDITFSDGNPLTGEDVIFTLKAIKNPLTEAAPQRNYFKDVARAELVDGDKYKVRFYCSEVFFKQATMIGTMLIMPKHIYDPESLMDTYSFKELEDIQRQYLDDTQSSNLEDQAYYKFAELFNSHNTSRNPLGSGPYFLKEWVSNDRVVLEKSPNYWKQKEEKNKNLVSRMVHKTVKTHEAALTSAKAQELDVVRSVPPKMFYDQTKSEKFKRNLNKTSSYYPNYSYIGWNNDHPIFGDKRVRRAMTHLCDRGAIIEALYYNDAQIAKGNIYFKRPEYHTGIDPLPFDPEKAKQLLAEAGWSDTDGDGVLDKIINGERTPFTFMIKTNQGNDMRKKIALLLIEEAKKVGIQADLQTMEWAIYLDDVRAHKFDAMILGWVFSVDEPDPYQVFHSSQSIARGSNSVSFNNPRADKLVELNRREFDPDKRKEYMYEFQEILLDEQPYTFLVCSQSHLIYHKRFKGVDIYPFRPGYDLQEWWVPNSMMMYAK